MWAPRAVASAAASVDDQLAAAVAGTALGPPRAGWRRSTALDPEHQLPRGLKWLGYVVVRAEFQPADPVLFSAPGRQHQDRRGPGRAHSRGDSLTGHVRQAEIEDHQVGEGRSRASVSASAPESVVSTVNPARSPGTTERTSTAQFEIVLHDQHALRSQHPPFPGRRATRADGHAAPPGFHDPAAGDWYPERRSRTRGWAPLRTDVM